MTLAWATASIGAILPLPMLTHLDSKWMRESKTFLAVPGPLIDLERHPIIRRVPGAAFYITDYNILSAELLAHFIGVRQELQDNMAINLSQQGKILGRMVREHLIAADLYIGIPTVGAIPYFSGLRTLDTLGLTDRYIARLPMPPVAKKVMAHAKRAPPEYVRERDPDLMSIYGGLVTNDSRVIKAVKQYATERRGTPVFISEPVFEDGYVLYARFRRSQEEMKDRFPGLILNPAAGE